jgi:MFS family permease
VLIRTRSLVLLAFGALYATVAYGVEINLSPYYTALGYGPEAIGGFGALRYLGRAVGALALPLLAWRMGRRATLIVGLLALAVTTLGQLGAVGPGRAGFWGFAFGAANGWDDALFNVLCMEASDPRMAASTYALFMAVSNLSTLGGGLFATAVEADGGRFERVLAACAVLPLLALAAIGPLARPAASERSDA